VEAIRRAGLRFETKTLDERVRVQASTEPAGVRGAELVLFCVKSQDTEAAGKALAPYLAREAVIVSLQNGVDNAERLAAVLGREVIAGVVYVAVEMAGPGHVRHHGRSELVIGRAAASEAIVAAFGEAGVPVEISDNVAGVLWAKLIVNCAYNALSAITQLPYGRLVQGDGIPAIMRDIVEECLAVARAAGVEVGWLNYADFGLNAYGSGFATSEAMIQKKPETVRKFLRASYRGFQEAFDNPEAAADILVKMFPASDRAIALAQIKETADIMNDPQVKAQGLGYLREDRMAATLDFVDRAYNVKGKVTLADIYTNSFLK
jgi:2-dehydropantoate 2-reductase